MDDPRYDLVLDDLPFDPQEDARRQLRLRAVRRQRQVAWIWIFHGALLVGSATLMGLARVAFIFFRRWIYQTLDGNLFEQLQHDLVRLDRLMELVLWAVPGFILVGIMVLIGSLGFLRRRRWAWRWLFVLSWMHLLGLIPVAIAFAYLVSHIGITQNLPAGVQQLSYIMDTVLLVATQLLLGWVHYHLRSPGVRALFLKDAPAVETLMGRFS